MNEKVSSQVDGEAAVTLRKSRIGGGSQSVTEKAHALPFEKLIYVELDDEITMVFDRIRRCPAQHVGLVVPVRAVVLQSIINLKILHKKVSEADKTITLVTADPVAKAIGEKVGIPVLDTLFSVKQETNPSTELRTFPGDRPPSKRERKMSISEVIRTQKSDVVDALVKKIKDRFNKKKGSTHTRLVFIAPNKQALFTLILVSVLLMLSIAYIALPGATIYITPRSSVVDPSFNVTFLDYEKNKNILKNPTSSAALVASFPIKPPTITKSFLRPATGKIFRGQHAGGVLNIINESSAPWDLAERTRFQTEEGIIFRISTAVRVPAASPAGPGKLTAAVTADELDAQGEVVGARGNIGPQRFFLPGLKLEESRKKLYAKSIEPMAGGATDVLKSVTEDDIKAAQEIAKRDVKKGAVEDLTAYLKEYNVTHGTQLSLLTDKNVVSTTEPAVTVPNVQPGTQADQFEVVASYQVSGIAFNKDELINALKERVGNRADPDKKIIHIDEEDLSYSFLDKNDTAGSVRLTTTMRALQMYDLDPEQETGKRFMKKISEHIVGMSVRDANEYLDQQTDEISRVEIKTWPIWAPTIPTVTDNIKFVIQEDQQI